MKIITEANRPKSPVSIPIHHGVVTIPLAPSILQLQVGDRWGGGGGGGGASHSKKKKNTLNGITILAKLYS